MRRAIGGLALLAAVAISIHVGVVYRFEHLEVTAPQLILANGLLVLGEFVLVLVGTELIAP